MLHSLALSCLAICWSLSSTHARFSQALPQDPHAFPKYRVTFLNGLPVLNETAERWLRDGLRGGEQEFLDQPFDHQFSAPQPWKEIDSGSESPEKVPQPVPPTNRLEYMKMGPKNAYLCLIPPPLDHSEGTSLEDEARAKAEVTPIHSWSLLEPLSHTCLYHRQSWFTYSYCHNSHVRQFRARPHTHPHPPGGYVPEEDTTYEAYTLGVAPPVPDTGAELTVAQQQALTQNLELVESAGSNYLVQRWNDGTVCDKTGRGREIEIQFHCSSMTGTDTILFVKETKTCHYVLVIHTPRLCGLPGFKSAAAELQQASIRCREIVPSLQGANKALPETSYPFKVPPREKPVLPPPPVQTKAAPVSQDQGKGQTGQSSLGGLTAEALKKALGALTGRAGEDGDILGAVVLERLEDGDYVMKLVDEDEFYEDDYDYVQGDTGATDNERRGEVSDDELTKFLRAAGFDVSGPKRQHGKEKKPEKKGDDRRGKKRGPAKDEDAAEFTHNLDEL